MPPERRSGGSNTPLPAGMDHWVVPWESIQLERPIGRGSFGWVYLARYNETPVACKVLVSTDGMIHGSVELPAGTMAQLQAEALIMSRLRHPNIVSFLGFCSLPPCILTGKQAQRCKRLPRSFC